MPLKIQISKSGKACTKNRSAANAAAGKQDLAHATQHDDETLDFERHL